MDFQLTRRTTMTIKTIGVVGAGQMGSGIAQISATSNFHVIMSDISEALVKVFGEYEEAMKGYDVFCDKFDALHIGGVVITQAGVKE